jgi:hypothetical protein
VSPETRPVARAGKLRALIAGPIPLWQSFPASPVYLKETSRIQALLCLYFFVLLTESLLERELRRAMARRFYAWPNSLPLIKQLGVAL